MKKIIGNIKITFEIEVTELNFAPIPTIGSLIGIAKMLPKEFYCIEVKCYYGWLTIYKDSNLQNLVELPNMKHDAYHAKLKQQP